MEEVILVNDQDEEIGVMEKQSVHKVGILHRAFSIFIFNAKNELLIQQRAMGKYHSGGLWSNTCCSHPGPSEDTLSAAHRRLKEEMGFDCELKHLFAFQYKADMGNGLIENEYDHVFTGVYEGAIQINNEEVSDYQFISLDKLTEQLKKQPEKFSAWLGIALPKLIMWRFINNK